MKNILKSILLFSLLVGVIACTDLEEDLFTQITTEISTPGIDDGSGGGGGNDPTSGAFSKLRSGSAGHGSYWSIQSVSTDEMAVTQKGGDWYDGGIWIDMHRHEYTASHGAVKNAWNDQYGGVQECNSILDGSLDANQTAQVRVLRAFFHYRLLDLYGNIKVLNTPGVDSPQVTRAVAFDLIETELLDILGITMVSPSMDLSGTALGLDMNAYRVNQFAALGLLAKLYLNAEVYTGTGRYQEAADAASYIIDNSPYTLADDSYSVPNLAKRPSVASDPDNLTGYAAVFAPNNSGNPEMIWSIDYDEVNGGGMNFPHMTLHYASQFTWNMDSQPWNGYSALEDFYNSYDDGDARKTNNFIVGPQLDYGGSALVDFAASDGKLEIEYTVNINELEPDANRVGGARLGKFSFKQFQRDDADNDYPIIRLGDVYLIRGEALARATGDWTLATADVNTIRARAGITAIGAATEASVLAERGREMFMEVTRRQDLIRFGKFDSSWWEKSNSDSFKMLFPIPSDAIDAASGTLSQNDGY